MDSLHKCNFSHAMSRDTLPSKHLAHHEDTPSCMSESLTVRLWIGMLVSDFCIDEIHVCRPYPCPSPGPCPSTRTRTCSQCSRTSLGVDVLATALRRRRRVAPPRAGGATLAEGGVGERRVAPPVRAGEAAGRQGCRSSSQAATLAGRRLDCDPNSRQCNLPAWTSNRLRRWRPPGPWRTPRGTPTQHGLVPHGLVPMQSMPLMPLPMQSMQHGLAPTFSMPLMPRVQRQPETWQRVAGCQRLA